MKKQVIIDKGNGFQQRLSYDDSTNKIIPETTFGPSETDSLLPIVGKKFIKESGISIGPGCIFCEGGVLRSSGCSIDKDIQCDFLKNIEVTYTECLGSFGTSLVRITTGSRIKAGVSIKFSTPGKTDLYLIGRSIPSIFPFMFYIHKSLPVTITFRLVTEEEECECVRTFTIDPKGTCKIIFKDPLNIYYDAKNMLIKYVNTSKKNPDIINLVCSNYQSSDGFIFPIKTGIVYNLSIFYKNPAPPRQEYSKIILWKDGTSTGYLMGWDSASLAHPPSVAVLGFEHIFNGVLTNEVPVILTTLGKGTGDKGGTGG